MAFEIAELNLQGTPGGQRSGAVAVSAFVSNELNIRTQEGDLVNLSFSSEQSLRESRAQTQSQELVSYQEIGTVAKAASNYSISVQGDLNEEELAAINKLAAEISPIASEFFANGGFDFETSGNVLAGNLGVIQRLELSLERTITASFTTRTVAQLPEDGFSPEDIEAASSNPAPALDTQGIRDFPALVEATSDAAFEAEAAKVPDKETILRSLNDLLDFIRERLRKVFDPENAELPPEIPALGDGAADSESPTPEPAHNSFS